MWLKETIHHKRYLTACSLFPFLSYGQKFAKPIIFDLDVLNQYLFKGHRDPPFCYSKHRIMCTVPRNTTAVWKCCLPLRKLDTWQRYEHLVVKCYFNNCHNATYVMTLYIIIISQRAILLSLMKTQINQTVESVKNTIMLLK